MGYRHRDFRRIKIFFDRGDDKSFKGCIAKYHSIRVGCRKGVPALGNMDKCFWYVGIYFTRNVRED